MMPQTGRLALGDITHRASNIAAMQDKPGQRRVAQWQPAVVDPQSEVDAIMSNLFHDETDPKIQVAANHLLMCQIEVTDKMRAILVDWLVDVHLKYKCRPETIYLAVNLLDRYLMNKPVEKKKLQLVGCVAMMLACKYEEIMPPEVRDFVHISANTYTRTEMLAMEKTMLVTLDYNLTVPTMWQFLTQLLEGHSDTTRHAAEYLSEQVLMCGKMTGFAPSLQAAACVYMARRILSVPNVWTVELENVSRYSECDMYEAVEVLEDYMKKATKLKVAAVRKKYSHSKYSCISRKFDAFAEL